MLNQEEKNLIVLQQIPFVAASYRKIIDALKDVLPAEDVFLALGTLVGEGKITMAISPKGDPEYSIKWNPQIDEERKLVTREFNKRLNENTIFYPRYESYVANLEENFIDGNYSSLIEAYGKLDTEYTKWHRNAKTNTAYPPKLHSLTAAGVLAYNVYKSLEEKGATYEYGVELDVISPEAMKDRPDEINAPKAVFNEVITTENEVTFVLADVLDHFHQQYRQNMWAYQFGTRYLFDNEGVNIWRNFAKKANYVYFNGYDTFRAILAAYTAVVTNPEQYSCKNITIESLVWNVSKDSNFTSLANFQASHDEEAKRAEKDFNELLSELPLPENTTITYKYSTVEEKVETLNDNTKEYIRNRYIGF